MDMHPDWFTRDAQGNFTERNGWDDVVDLNYSNAHMRAALIGAMQYWMEHFSIDGFRCDMAHLVPLDFWHQARTACEAIRPLFWLAECEEVNYHQVFDVSYAWSWMHASEKIAKHQAGINEIYDVLHAYAQYPIGSLKLFFTSNHDENSWNGTEYEKFGVAAKAWAVFTFTWKGMPLIYSGQELPNKKRLLFFDKDQIEWDQNPALHDFYRTLIQMRKQYPAITQGATFNLPVSSNGAMAFLRYDAQDILLVGLNLTGQAQKIYLSHEHLDGSFKNIFSEMVFHFHKEISFELMPGDFFVYVKV
jgi:glycosidase